jgi:hypothetical protein
MLSMKFDSRIVGQTGKYPRTKSRRFRRIIGL